MTTGSAIRVIVLVDEATLTSEQQSALPIDMPTLEELVQQIQNTPPNPNNIIGSNDLLAERRLHPVTEPDPNFNFA